SGSNSPVATSGGGSASSSSNSPQQQQQTTTGMTANLNMITTSIGQAAMSVLSSTKYIMDPDLRSRKMSQIVKNANVEFCKAFWQLTETSIVQVNKKYKQRKHTFSKYLL